MKHELHYMFLVSLLISLSGVMGLYFYIPLVDLVGFYKLFLYIMLRHEWMHVYSLNSCYGWLFLIFKFYTRLILYIWLLKVIRSKHNVCGRGSIKGVLISKVGIMGCQPYTTEVNLRGC